MVLHMKMCKSLHIAHFEYATVQYLVPHFGSLFCTLEIFQCAKSCTLQCNISKCDMLTLYASFYYFRFSSHRFPFTTFIWFAGRGSQRSGLLGWPRCISRLIITIRRRLERGDNDFHNIWRRSL